MVCNNFVPNGTGDCVNSWGNGKAIYEPSCDKTHVQELPKALRQKKVCNNFVPKDKSEIAARWLWLSPRVFLSNSLVGSFRKGPLQKISANFCEIFRKLSAEFPRPFLMQSNVFSTKFPQNFRKLSAKTPSGRHREQAKANLDPRVAPRVGPRVAPRVRPRELPREHPRGPISLFSALQGLPRNIPRRCPRKGPRSGRSGFTCPVFTSSVL